MRITLRGAVATAAIAVASIGSALAAPLTGSFGISVYQGNAGGSINSAGAQALITNPLIAGGTQLYSGTYTGAIDFDDGGVNNLLRFLQSAGGTLSGSTSALDVILSNGGFGTTSVVVLTGTVASPISGLLSHDDGVGLYQALSLVTPLGASSPTNVVDTPYSLAAGGFQLVYVATNGIPEVLTMNVPAPATLALLGVAMAGLGFTRRQRSTQ